MYMCIYIEKAIYVYIYVYEKEMATHTSILA